MTASFWNLVYGVLKLIKRYYHYLDIEQRHAIVVWYCWLAAIASFNIWCNGHLHDITFCSLGLICYIGVNTLALKMIQTASLCWRQVASHTLQWHHNGQDGVSNHRHHDCLLNRLFKRRSKKTSKLRVTGLCARNRWPVNSSHKWPVTRKMFQFDAVIM